MTWNPEQYLQFSDHRLRPALDLLAQIPLDSPTMIYDLGCGPGTVTEFLAKRWPSARIVGLDSSKEMLARAATRLPDMDWQLADIQTWQPPTPAPLIFSNAALQWLDDDDTLFPKLFSALAPEGLMAVQMPANFDQPSHRLLFELAKEPPWRDDLAAILRENPVAPPSHYWRLLTAQGAKVNVWETTYYQALEGQDAVLRWMEGTTLRPIFAALAPAQHDNFRERFAARLRVAYRVAADGLSLFPFRRLFIVAFKPGDASSR
jgi:trans-aconitate 2-methyltransferase